MTDRHYNVHARRITNDDVIVMTSRHLACILMYSWVPMMMYVLATFLMELTSLACILMYGWDQVEGLT